jgi:hypothetical protein
MIWFIFNLGVRLAAFVVWPLGSADQRLNAAGA